MKEFIGELEQEVVLPSLNLPDISRFSLNTDNDIERIAEECRRHWGPGPVSSMVNLTESIGVLVAHVSGVDERVDAFTVNDVRPLIIRNSAKSSVCRFRSDIGHELGHLVLHEGVVTGDKLTEHQANHFSCAFMLPRISFINEFPKMRGTHLDWTALEIFKVRWRVSLRMCLYRASVLGLITPEKMRTGFIYLNSKGHVSRERGDEHILPEEPGVINRAVNMPDDVAWALVLKQAMIKSDFVKAIFSINRPVLPDDPKLVFFDKYRKTGRIQTDTS